MTSIASFVILPISYSKQSTHYIYARAHAHSKKSDFLPQGRTIFLVNVPPDATEREITLLFRNCGTVEKIHFSIDIPETLNNFPESDDSETSETEQDVAAPDMDTTKSRKRRKIAKESPPVVSPLPSGSSRSLRTSGCCAHVVFLDESALPKALTPPKKPHSWPTSDEEPNGVARYAAIYDALRPPLDVVKSHADTSLELYDYLLAKTKRAAASKYKKGEAIVDEDGFTLVARGGAYGQTVGGGVAVASKKFMEEVATGDDDRKRGKGRKRKEKKEKTNFYSFQRAEKQRKDLLDLRKRFQADKEKVEKLKQSRRFKPY